MNTRLREKSEAKPVSFLEDCAVELKDLAEYTDKLTAIFDRNGVKGTWYAHASVGCLHVRPILNLKQSKGAQQLRDIAEEAFAMVREYKGSHSGEHGDGLVRSEFHRDMFGDEMVDKFATVKEWFDPAVLLNPGKIVDFVKAPVADRFPAQFAPYQLFGCDMRKRFDGTMFRFPLRTEEQAAASNLDVH